MNSTNKKTPHGGYTLVELMAASMILAVVCGSATMLSLTMITKEEIDQRVGSAMNIQENAGRLFNLGLSGAEISALLPEDPSVTGLSITETVENLTDVGSVDKAVITMSFQTTPPTTTTNTASNWTGGADGSGTVRQGTIEAYRAR